MRVVHTRETVRRRERVAGQWREQEETSSWYWATTLTRRQRSTRRVWQAGHRRWDVENACCNTLSMHWGWTTASSTPRRRSSQLRTDVIRGVGAALLLLAAEGESAVAGGDRDAAGFGGGTAAQLGPCGTGAVVSVVGPSARTSSVAQASSGPPERWPPRLRGGSEPCRPSAARHRRSAPARNLSGPASFKR